MESAWSKLARGVEHQRMLARRTREYLAADPYSYERCDNLGDATAEIVQMEWRLNVRQAPPQWSVLLGDAVANLRDTLDHAMWAAVHEHSGPPAKPKQIEFPITTDAAVFQNVAKKLQRLVAPDVWDMIKEMQPFHGGRLAHTVPLEVLRWLSNVDKHRFLHEVGCTAIDFGPTLVDSPVPMQVVEDWRHEGPAENGQVLVRLKVRRPHASTTIDVLPTFAHLLTVQISDNPVAYRTLSSAMDATRDAVLGVLVATTHLLGEPMPDADSLELGAEHEDHAADFGGNLATIRTADGTIHRMPLPRPAADHPRRAADAGPAQLAAVLAFR